MFVTLKIFLYFKKFRVHVVEHLVEHETTKVAHKTPKKSFTAVAHGII